jgi:hypothetical protein
MTRRLPWIVLLFVLSAAAWPMTTEVSASGKAASAALGVQLARNQLVATSGGAASAPALPSPKNMLAGVPRAKLTVPDRTFPIGALS